MRCLRGGLVGLALAVPLALNHSAQADVHPVLQFRGELLDAFLQVFAPITADVRIGGQLSRVTIVDARYCGAGAPSEGKALAVLSFGDPPRWMKGEHYVRPSRVLKKEMCATSLRAAASEVYANEEFAAELGLQMEESALARINMTWTPTGLALAVAEVAFPQASKLTPQQQETWTSALRNSGQALRTIPIQKVGIRAGDAIIDLESRVYFSDFVYVAVRLSGQGAPAFLEKMPTLPRTPSAEANLVLWTPYSFLNAFLGGYLQNRPHQVHTNNTQIGDLRVEALAFNVSGDKLHAVGKVRDASKQAYDVQIDISRDTLLVSEVKINAVDENCGALRVDRRPACLARNLARRALAELASKVVSQRIAGKPLHDLNKNVFLVARPSGRDILFEGEVVRELATSDEFGVEAQIEIRAR